MKVQCSCGTKHEFEITPVMANTPVKFVCPVCGTDSSEFVDSLIRRELGQTETPHGVPVPILAPAPRPAAAPAATFIEECSPQPTQARPPRPAAVRLHAPTPPS